MSRYLGGYYLNGLQAGLPRVESHKLRRWG